MNKNWDFEDIETQQKHGLEWWIKKITFNFRSNFGRPRIQPACFCFFFLGKFQDEEMNKCVTNKNRKGGILMVDPTALKNLQITFDGSEIRRENHLTCIRNPAN